MSFGLTRVRHRLAMRRLTVAEVDAPSPTIRRITLRGDLAGFSSPSPDDHVKVIFPRDGESELKLPEVGENGIVGRPPADLPMRDYTPHSIDLAAGTLALDIVVHGDGGPGSVWAMAAAPGQELGVAGPRGSHVLEGRPDWLLLAGDDSAIPAIARRLEDLAPESVAIVAIESDHEVALPRDDDPAVQVTWLARDGRPGAALVEHVRALALPVGDGFAWVGCEAAAAATLRRYVRDDLAIPKNRSKITGYWKLGTSNHHDPPE